MDMLHSLATGNSNDEGGASTKAALLSAATADVLSSVDGGYSLWEYINGESVDLNKSPNLLVHANSCNSNSN